MNPTEISAHLRAVADYVDRSPEPSREKVAAHLGRLVDGLDRVAGKVTKFVNKDVNAAAAGLDALIAQLTKAAQTMNPQDEGRAELESAVKRFQGLKDGLMQTVKGLEKVDV